MIKIKIIEKQINTRTLAEMIPCPRNTITPFKLTNMMACKACSRNAGIDGGHVLCGARGSNQTVNFADARRHPALWEVFGEGERDGFVMTYGVPVSTKRGY